MKESGNKNTLIGFGFALLATALWSGNFVVASGLSDSIQPFSLSFYRWLVATIVFTPFAFRSVKRDWATIRVHFPYLLLTALLGVSIFNTLIYFAGQTTTAVNLSLIALTFPIFILLISAIVYKERITSVRILGIIIVLMGVLLINSKGNPAGLLNLRFNAGDSLMLLAAFTFAIHSILIKNKPKKISIISLQYTTFFMGMIILLPFYLYSKDSIIGFEPEFSVIGALLYIGIFSSLISFVSWNKAIDKIGASSAGMIYYLMPLFSGLVAWVLLDEKLKYYHLISGIMIVTGILISNHRARRV